MTDYIELLLDGQEQERDGETAQLEAGPRPWYRPRTGSEPSDLQGGGWGDGRGRPFLHGSAGQATYAEADAALGTAAAGIDGVQMAAHPAIGPEPAQNAPPAPAGSFLEEDGGGPSSSSNAGGASEEGALSWVAGGAGAQGGSWAVLSQRLQAARQVSENLKRPAGRAPLEAAETERAGIAGASAAQLDKLFQRDARRYDGGFSLY